MFSLSNLFGVVINAAGKINTYAAGIENSVHQIEASDPIVASLVQVALNEAGQHGIPVNAIESVSNAALAVAQVVAKAQVPANTSQAISTANSFVQAAGAAVAQAAPMTASTVNTVVNTVNEAAGIVSLFTAPAADTQAGPARSH